MTRGYTELRSAVWAGDIELVKIRIDSGTDISARTADGQLLLPHEAGVEEGNIERWQVLHVAVRHCFPVVVDILNPGRPRRELEDGDVQRRTPYCGITSTSGHLELFFGCPSLGKR